MHTTTKPNTRVNLIDIYVDENIGDLQTIAELRIYKDYYLKEEGCFTVQELEDKAFNSDDNDFSQQIYLVIQLMTTIAKCRKDHEAIIPSFANLISLVDRPL